MNGGLLVALVAAVACAGPPAPQPVASPTSAASSSPSVVPSATPNVGPSLIADVCHVAGAVYCALNPAVSQATIRSTICVSGWTSTVRPKVSYTEPIKIRQLAALASLHPNDPNWTLKGTEEDHRVPLEMGGAPRDIANLSPEEHPGSNAKDADENAGKAKVCAGTLTLAAAQAAFVAKWLGPGPAYRQ